MSATFMDGKAFDERNRIPMTAIPVTPQAGTSEPSEPREEPALSAPVEEAPLAETSAVPEARAEPAFRLYFLRHAPTGSAAEWDGPDEERPLTEKGRLVLRKTRKGLRELVGTPDAILTSPLARCAQTAEIVGRALRYEGVVQPEPSLVPGGSPEALDDILRTHEGKRDLVLVGHGPDLERWVAALTTGRPEPFMELKKGGLCRVDVEATPERRAVLRWALTPEQVRKLA